MKKLRDESGQALIISALGMTCLLGFVALAADVGVMLREKRLAQTAADAAAIAGALEIHYSSGSISTAAQAAAVQNGFTDGTNGATVVVHHGPASGPHHGDSNYVEAIVSRTQSTLFMSLFGVVNMTPTARAVAQNGGSSFGCVYALSPTGTGMSLAGKFTFSAPNCGIIVDSTDPAALSFTGNAGTLLGGSVGVAGGCSGTCTYNPPANTPVTTGIVPQSDPLNFLKPSMPDPTVNPLKTTCTVPNAGGKKGAGVLTGTITPPGGTVCYSGDVTISNATLNAGTYVFTGNVTLDGTVTGNGVTLDLSSPSGSLSENTNSTLNIVAPTDPNNVFHGIAIMAPTTNTTGTLSFDIGNATGTIEGIVYAPDATLRLQDNGAKKKGGLTLITDLIVGTINSGPSPISIQSYSQTVSGSPLTKVTLVE